MPNELGFTREQWQVTCDRWRKAVQDKEAELKTAIIRHRNALENDLVSTYDKMQSAWQRLERARACFRDNYEVAPPEWR